MAAITRLIRNLPAIETTLRFRHSFYEDKGSRTFGFPFNRDSKGTTWRRNTNITPIIFRYLIPVSKRKLESKSRLFLSSNLSTKEKLGDRTTDIRGKRLPSIPSVFLLDAFKETSYSEIGRSVSDSSQEAVEPKEINISGTVVPPRREKIDDPGNVSGLVVVGDSRGNFFR